MIHSGQQFNEEIRTKNGRQVPSASLQKKNILTEMK